MKNGTKLGISTFERKKTIAVAAVAASSEAAGKARFKFKLGGTTTARRVLEGWCRRPEVKLKPNNNR